jgi:hypothetical protein
MCSEPALNVIEGTASVAIYINYCRRIKKPKKVEKLYLAEFSKSKRTVISITASIYLRPNINSQNSY